MFGKLMPRYTDRWHELPYPIGDSPKAVRHCRAQKKGADGGWYIDINVQALADGEGCCHWGNAEQNGLLYYQVSKTKRRPLTKEELRRPMVQWKTADFVRLRYTKRAGTSYLSRLRPYTLEEMIVYCKRKGVIPCFELKSPQFRQKKRAMRILTIARKHGHTVYFMALINMRGCQGKCAAFVSVGLQFAVLAHGMRKPIGFNNWTIKPTRVWGNWKR